MEKKDLLEVCIKFQTELTKLLLNFMILEEPKTITIEIVDKFYNSGSLIFENLTEENMNKVINNKENNDLMDLIVAYQAAMINTHINLTNNIGCKINDDFIKEFVDMVDPLVDKLVEYV